MEPTTNNMIQLSEDYKRVEQAILYLESYHHEQPDLIQIANYVGLSEYHFQRLFTRWVGISPKRYLQYLTKEHAKQLLAESSDVLSAAYASGLSSPSRLHDLFVTCEAVTPGEYKSRGAGLTVRYGIHPSPFGDCLIASTKKGICFLGFLVNGDQQRAVRELRSTWRAAQLLLDQAQTGELITRLFQYWKGQESAPLQLHLQGTNFQLKVWEALLQIPSASITTYTTIARYIGETNAARAVGNAVGRNPIPVLIPCHRVIRKEGEYGGYRYGIPRKKALLAYEMAWRETRPEIGVLAVR